VQDELSGADIKALCTEAGLLALRERRMRVTHVDFKKVSVICSPVLPPCLTPWTAAHGMLSMPVFRSCTRSQAGAPVDPLFIPLCLVEFKPLMHITPMPYSRSNLPSSRSELGSPLCNAQCIAH